MKKLVMAGLFMAASVCHGQDPNADFSHSYELTASDTALTLAQYKIIDAVDVDGKLGWEPPVMTLTLDALYRQGENTPQAWCEFLHYDVPGVALGVILEVLLPSAKKR